MRAAAGAASALRLADRGTSRQSRLLQEGADTVNGRRLMAGPGRGSGEQRRRLLCSLLLLLLLCFGASSPPKLGGFHQFDFAQDH